MKRYKQLTSGLRYQIYGIAVPSQSEAEKMLNVSVDSVQRAKKMLDQGSEELIQKVDADEIASEKSGFGNKETYRQANQ
jgi:hypothetical protein